MFLKLNKERDKHLNYHGLILHILQGINTVNANWESATGTKNLIKIFFHKGRRGRPIGPPLEHMREVQRALAKIGDELDRDEQLQRYVICFSINMEIVGLVWTCDVSIDNFK